jgi:hypothetical protein
MEKQIENILIKVDEGTMPVQQALSELLRLFNVSGSLEDRLFNLANDFAVDKQGEVAVKLHGIHNGLRLQ